MNKTSHQENTASPKSEPWHALTAEEVLEHLKVHENGLSDSEAAERMAQYGPNQLTEAPRPGFLRLLWEQFNNFIVMLLIVAAIDFRLAGRMDRCLGHHRHRRA